MDVPNLQQLSLVAASNEHVVDPIIEYQYSNAKGEGYLGIVKSIKLLGKNKDLDVIVKFASPSEKLRDQAPIREAFETEIWFYEKIIPAFIKYQLDEGIKNPFVCFPKCYATEARENEEMLLLENLKDSGFVSWDRQKPMNHEHLQFVFKEYGRFHAISFAMKHKEHKMYKEITSKLTDVVMLFYTKSGFKHTLKHMTEELKGMFNSQTEKDLHQAYLEFSENGGKLTKETLKKDDVSIIIHGDCWSNNMMFKYKDSNNINEPLTMQLIDFQLCKEGPPVLDLAYFFYVCAADDSLNRLNEYLCAYHQSLKETLAQLNCDVEKLYPFTKLKDQWKKYGKFGLIMAHVLIKAMLSDSDEVPDLSEIADTGKDIMNSFNFKSRNEEEYRRRMKDLFTHLHRNHFI